MRPHLDPLPTGKVTFLLTDIEGSTQAWQASPGEMTALVSRHYDILESGTAAHGGQRPQEQGEGDSVVAVFVDASSALAAAVETQRALRRELPDLPVRMALHTGETMLRNENNYVGLTIIRCARIRSCGHGGQILLSDATAAELSGSLAEPFGLVDLGLYGLRGLEGRDRIWQVTHPSIPATFAPLRAGASAAGNLPTPISSFIGRRSDLADLSELLISNRLLTLTGAAGVGKSRLANAAASAAANSMPGGVWWVGLSGVSDDDVQVVETAIMRACAMSPGEEHAGNVISTHFRSIADSLLVVDGYERAPSATAAVVEQLLARCPDARVLATGRDPLHISGEVEHQVTALSIPEADFVGSVAALEAFDSSRLFLERAAAHDVVIADGDATEIARICRDLRGVPLAIELAAAATGSTSIAELAASFEHTAGDAALGVALTTSIAWTHQLLKADVQTVLRRLAVFRSDFEIEAAAAVARGPQLDATEIAAAIRALFEQRLLAVDDESQRISIPPAIRTFAGERLAESVDQAGAVARHGTWFAAVAERFADADAAIPLSLLASDEMDVIAALETSMQSTDTSVAYRILVALGLELRALGHPDVADRAAAWLCTRTPGDGEERWAAAVARMCLDQASDDAANIHDYADEALAIAEMVGDGVSVQLIERRDRETVGTVGGDMAPGAMTQARLH